MSVADNELVWLCKKNRREGYELLFEKYQRYIYSLCYGFTGIKEDALDLTQEVYFKLYRSMAGFDQGRPLLPWIKRIATNTCLNYVRKDRGTHVELTEFHEADSSLNPESTLLRGNDQALLQQAISQLPETERMAIILRHMQGLSYDEIAKAMNCPLGTVKTYIYRGRSALRQTLRAQGIWGDTV